MDEAVVTSGADFTIMSPCLIILLLSIAMYRVLYCIQN